VLHGYFNSIGDEAPVPESAEGIKPTFTERPVIRQSEDGGNVTFECRCVGDPTPTVTWYENNIINIYLYHTKTLSDK